MVLAEFTHPPIAGDDAYNARLLEKSENRIRRKSPIGALVSTFALALVSLNPVPGIAAPAKSQIVVR